MNFEAKGNTVYEDATIVKVPMSRILDKEVNKEYSRYNGANVVFACPARNDDVLYQAYEYRGETYHRLQDVSTLDELNIGDPGDLLFDVAFDMLLKTDIIPSESKESLPISAKMIIFACVSGLILADTLNYEIYISIRICSKVWCL